MSLRINKTCLCYVVLLFLTSVFIFTPFSYGAPTSVDYGENHGDGSGKGTGTGEGLNAGIALNLVSSSVADGDTGVPLDPVIQLDFNKNVVNVTVLENNSKCFHLIDNSGAPVPVSLIFPDDQLQSTFKRSVFILPKENLKMNSKYELVVDSNLLAKNSTGIDNAYSITFETGAVATGGRNEALLELGNDIIVYNTALAKTEYSVPREKDVPKLDQKTQPIEKQPLDVNKLSSIILIAIAAVFVCATLIFFLQKRKGKNQS
ncbi:MAG: hypothetical protein A4E53_02880 [Pelotomaculum sp. PtaB.Bin104]|nr:MAG: hypothetical protein A4E53_02880 [Pelotomaculum sp. PtaB.Bin104]